MLSKFDNISNFKNSVLGFFTVVTFLRKIGIFLRLSKLDGFCKEVAVKLDVNYLR